MTSHHPELAAGYRSQRQESPSPQRHSHRHRKDSSRSYTPDSAYDCSGNQGCNGYSSNGGVGGSSGNYNWQQQSYGFNNYVSMLHFK